MHSRYFSVLRIISIIVLIFFSWTFGGLFDIAYAIKMKNQKSGVKIVKKQKRVEEELLKSVGSIEQLLKDRSVDRVTRKKRLKSRKNEIDGFDREMRAQFRATAKRLKNAGISKKILKRHFDFVKKYEATLKELNDNLDAIERATTDAAIDGAIEKANRHLKKIKPPKKHKPIDPNKLPHRSMEPVYKKPRTEPGKFRYNVTASIPENQLPLEQYDNPILLASNGDMQGIISDEGLDIEMGRLFDRNLLSLDMDPFFPKLDSSELLLAASDPPTSDSLAETIEVQFTEAIIAKAAELENDPVKIYNWVRNNIEFVPTYGSIQGADYCLQTKLCNGFDTASLLIALLRVSDIHARYVEGTVEIPIEKVMNWLGGFTDKNAALDFLASAGVPVSGMTIGGEIAYAMMEHVWVEAWVDYMPSRGARHTTGQGDLWIVLDPSFKQYTYTEGMDIEAAVPFDAQSFIDQIQATATINEPEGYVTDVDSAYIDQTMTDYQTQVENYIDHTYPDATVGDMLGTKVIVEQDFPYLLGTLPYRMILRGDVYSNIPDMLRHKLSFSVVKDQLDEMNGTALNITKSLPELAGKKITLSYSPATQEDEDVINSFLPEPHADGTPIDPSELPTSLSAYLINLKPELRINGVVAAEGASVGMGATEDFKMTFTAPNSNADMISNDIEAGEYVVVGLDLGKISEEQMTAVKAKLEDSKEKLEAQDFTDMTKDDVIGNLLHTTAVSYFAELDTLDKIQAKKIDVNAIRLPSEILFSYEMKVDKFIGMPISIKTGGLAMDADRIITLTGSYNADKEKQKQL